MTPLFFPINSTSLGASALHILENFEQPFSLNVIGGQPDVSSFEPLSKEFAGRVSAAIEHGFEKHNVLDTSIKLWHPFASLERITQKQILYTFHEVDAITSGEKNALNQQEAIIVPSNYVKEVFEKYGIIVPIYVVPLGVDRKVFYPLEKYKNKDTPYTFLMAGKFEARKLHFEILQAFAGTFAGNPKVKLRCCISNRFMDMNNVYQLIQNKIFGGKIPSNIEFIDWLPTERHFADFLSHGDCLVSPSRAESFNLPLLQALSAGIQVVTNANHAHADYITNRNAIVLKDSGMETAKDDVFFRNDGKTNTGQWFSIQVNEIARGMIEAYKLGRKFNLNGVETAEQYSWKKTSDNIYKIWETFATT